MDTIRIHALEVETIVGHHDWERRLPRTLTLDIELAADFRAAAQSDHLEDAIDYAAVAKAAGDFVRASRYTLIETLAEKLADKLLQDFKPARVRLSVHKPGAIAGAKSVTVTVERPRG